MQGKVEDNGREMQVLFVFLLRETHALIAFGACSVIKGIKLFMYKRVKKKESCAMFITLKVVFSKGLD